MLEHWYIWFLLGYSYIVMLMWGWFMHRHFWMTKNMEEGSPIRLHVARQTFRLMACSVIWPVAFLISDR